MNVVIFGLSGASNALGKTLADSSNVSKVYDFFATQGKSSKYIPLGMKNIDYRDIVKNFIESSSIDLIIPTALEFQFDWFRSLVSKRNIPCLISNSSHPGMLEWSKVLSKEIISEAGIPTPEFKIITVSELINDFLNIPRPFVIKYNMYSNFGLQTYIVKEDNYLSYYSLLKSLNFNPEKKVIIETYIDSSREISYHILCNEVNWQYLGSARDYKKRYDNDQGHNTFSMGAYCPVEPYDESVIHSYIDKLLNTLKKRNTPYIGILYLGIMISKTGDTYLLEINTRPGDPETQTFLPLVETDLSEVLLKTATNSYIPKIEFSNKSSVSLVITSEDFKEISSNNNLLDLSDIHCDLKITRPNVKNMIHSTLTSVDVDIVRARDKIYDSLAKINTEGYSYRTDIGKLK